MESSSLSVGPGVRLAGGGGASGLCGVGFGRDAAGEGVEGRQ